MKYNVFQGQRKILEKDLKFRLDMHSKYVVCMVYVAQLEKKSTNKLLELISI